MTNQTENHPVPLKLLLAPMDAITHQAFRNLVGRFGGCDEYFNEMINASSLLAGGAWEKYYLLDGPAPEKFVWQLTDKNGDKMAEAARILAQKNGIGIDLNMGCSAPQIAKTGAGIAWMTKPISETRDMVRKVKSALENAAKNGAKAKRLSVKLRLGDESYTEEKLHDFCAILIEEGVQMITLHARTQKQKHSRPSNWQTVEHLALRFPEIPVILNGDVKDKASFERAKETAPHAQGIMIATAAAQKPWIFKELKMPVISTSCLSCPSDRRAADMERSERRNLSSENETDLSTPLSSFATVEVTQATATSNVVQTPVISEATQAALEIDCERLALDFIDDVEKFQPREFWQTRLRRFFAYYCLNFSFAHYFQTSMLNAQNNDDARAKIREYFEKCPNDKIRAI